ncbi:MAG: Abi family protein, partial [Burkholderiales bacterium]|nr:Abi family protein [Burkholderiales bacterium]
MEPYEKKYTTPAAQVQALKDNGLLFAEGEGPDSETYAKIFIERVGFTRFKTYLYFFSNDEYQNQDETEAMEKEMADDNGPSKYLEKTSFADVKRVYDFDVRLRSLVAEALGEVEVTIRSIWANILSKKDTGAHAYRNPKYFYSGEDFLKDKLMNKQPLTKDQLDASLDAYFDKRIEEEEEKRQKKNEKRGDANSNNQNKQKQPLGQGNTQNPGGKGKNKKYY